MTTINKAAISELLAAHKAFALETYITAKDLAFDPTKPVTEDNALDELTITHITLEGHVKDGKEFNSWHVTLEDEDGQTAILLLPDSARRGVEMATLQGKLTSGPLHRMVLIVKQGAMGSGVCGYFFHQLTK